MGVAKHFIAEIIEADLAKHPGMKLRLRFPPEPNGHLHLGHAKAMVLNYTMAQHYGGSCHVRFDDTDPAKESLHYVKSILKDIRWLGYEANETYSSDYFSRLYEQALRLIDMNLAYVDSHSSEVFAERFKGTPTRAGLMSPDRNRSVAENRDLFEEMHKGKHPEGAYTLRAKIDMASPNMHMRDPAIYRIKKMPHFRNQEAWSIYPLYDFAHCLCDAFENITHSLCSLEFEVHRPLYEWFLDQLGLGGPRQIEFARLALAHNVLSKRKIAQLIATNEVSGWEDPQLYTLSGLRRRGYTPEAITGAVTHIGLSKRKSLTSPAVLEWFLRTELNLCALRRFVILDPLRIVLTNYPEKENEELVAANNPEDPKAGTRLLPFGRTLFIERADFMEEPTKKFFRLAPGREVRLKHAYIIQCDEVVKNLDGSIDHLRCSYDPKTKSGTPGANKKVKATLGWVEASQAYSLSVTRFHACFLDEDPESVEAYLEALNPLRKQVFPHAIGEPSIREAQAGIPIQFERQGYFCLDTKQKDCFYESAPLKGAASLSSLLS